MKPDEKDRFSKKNQIIGQRFHGFQMGNHQFSLMYKLLYFNPENKGWQDSGEIRKEKKRLGSDLTSNSKNLIKKGLIERREVTFKDKRGRICHKKEYRLIQTVKNYVRIKLLINYYMPEKSIHNTPYEQLIRNKSSSFEDLQKQEQLEWCDLIEENDNRIIDQDKKKRKKLLNQKMSILDKIIDVDEQIHAHKVNLKSIKEFRNKIKQGGNFSFNS